ncbi:cytidylyltransferase domain-containing protein [Mixta calida]|uniref:cytidylyltransferase domain-containing protein n=1 Tax=Mixta calida TaxID=665913 RepID=UPI002FDDCCD3
MTLKKIAIIPARSGSKGLPNKNILMLLDRPLIAYTIEAAVKADIFERIIVSTDSLEYRDIAEQYGAEVVLRDKSLATDKATSFMVIEDVLKKNSGYDYFVLLQPTSPFRNEHHIKEAIQLFENKENASFLASVVESTKSSSLIKVIDEDLTLKNFNLDYSNYRRQNTKEYSPNGAIFIGKTQSYLEQKHFFGRNSIAYIMNKEDSIDIDDRVDFEVAIAIQMKKNKDEIILRNIIKRISEKKKLFNDCKEITLIGHSIFDFWEIDSLRDIKVNNLGIAGINSEQYYNLILSTGIINEIGGNVFLFAGTNDMVIEGWTTDYTINWAEKMIFALRELNPVVNIYFLAVPPVRGRIERNNDTINILNQALEKKFKEYIFVNWVPLTDCFYDQYGSLPKNFTTDGLHFSSTAYEHLEQLLLSVLK